MCDDNAATEHADDSDPEEAVRTDVDPWARFARSIWPAIVGARLIGITNPVVEGVVVETGWVPALVPAVVMPITRPDPSTTAPPESPGWMFGDSSIICKSVSTSPPD
jgi:hypothetical protein